MNLAKRVVVSTKLIALLHYLRKKIRFKIWYRHHWKLLELNINIKSGKKDIYVET